MGIIKFFDRVRAYPTATRKKITLLSAVILWTLIVSVWWIAVSRNTSPEHVGVIPNVGVASPWDAFSQTVGAAKDEAAGAVGGIFEGVPTAIEAPDTAPEQGLPPPVGIPAEDVEVEWAGSAPVTAGAPTEVGNRPQVEGER